MPVRTGNASKTFYRISDHVIIHRQNENCGTKARQFTPAPRRHHRIRLTIHPIHSTRESTSFGVTCINVLQKRQFNRFPGRSYKTLNLSLCQILLLKIGQNFDRYFFVTPSTNCTHIYSNCLQPHFHFPFIKEFRATPSPHAPPPPITNHSACSKIW
jgi:hypothetical protein